MDGYLIDITSFFARQRMGGRFWFGRKQNDASTPQRGHGGLNFDWSSLVRAVQPKTVKPSQLYAAMRIDISSALLSVALLIEPKRRSRREFAGGLI